ncbi:MAG: hypothetical protein M3Z22_08325 [Verrucomicrobiota bacterium]|nr:hypothetical protein [Verrucomicrobiota bacterium]
MATDDTARSFEQPHSTFGTWVGVVLLFAVFGLLVWVVIGLMPRGDDYEQKRATARVDKLKAARDEANGALNGYAWVDKEKGTVRVPIHRAMELTLAELSQKKPAPGNPIPADLQPGIQRTAPVTAAPAPTAPPGASARSTPQAVATEGKDSENRGQKAAENNPPNAAPGTQPGPSATAAASPPAGANQPQPGVGEPTATPVQSPAGTPRRIPGKTP